MIFSCEEPQKFPNTPQIDFYQMYVVDTVNQLGPNILHKLVFRVVDGDGNLGTYENDTTNNLFYTLYQKKNGVYEEFLTDVPLRIPYTDPVGLNEYFKAEIQVDIEYSKDLYEYIFRDTIINEVVFYIDTVMYSFYVFDRDSNYSNVEKTFDIPRDFFGVITDTTAFVPIEL